MSTFTIKPPEWTYSKCEGGDDDPPQHTWMCNTALGSLVVRTDFDDESKWVWSSCFAEYYDETGPTDCDSAEDGKAKAWAYFVERLMPALEPATTAKGEERG